MVPPVSVLDARSRSPTRCGARAFARGPSPCPHPQSRVGPSASRLPSISAICRIRKHTYRASEPVARRLERPTPTAAQPLAGPHGPKRLEPGVERSIPNLRRPQWATARPADGSQLVTTRASSCRVFGAKPDWKHRAARPAVRPRERSGTPGQGDESPPRLRRGCPRGPLPTAPRERDGPLLHPGCFPPLPTSRLCTHWRRLRRRPLRGRPHRPSASRAVSAFVTDAVTTPDERG